MFSWILCCDLKEAKQLLVLDGEFGMALEHIQGNLDSSRVDLQNPEPFRGAAVTSGPL